MGKGAAPTYSNITNLIAAKKRPRVRAGFKINRHHPDHHRSLKVAVVGAFQTFGLEEWVSGSPTWLTTVHCSKSSGIIREKDAVELYKSYFVGKDRVNMEVRTATPEGSPRKRAPGSSSGVHRR